MGIYYVLQTIHGELYFFNLRIYLYGMKMSAKRSIPALNRDILVTGKFFCTAHSV